MREEDTALGVVKESLGVRSVEVCIGSMIGLRHFPSTIVDVK